ncbi:S1 family peptidase [Alteromonas naphthalenivorans]|uniref:Peptidase S1 and S6, chymotrypsin/Hap n=1 Tax=Alteromonas naphthalenivorans TaxID=715451 RepID=F5ZAS9_ALTNA|nr:serine protease [Alteromonas naphthalenivorans]AEF02289.1 peptidase S1 and S6, chymotrypsin/Hap [Alteromonas naphthalenivorans]|tara:strand:- start:2729 stop:3511 length:783 start_codon:yes stop_codon:yes gene_type:complete
MKNIVRLLLFSFAVLTTSGFYCNANDNSFFPDVVKEVTKGTVAIAINAPIKHTAPRILGTGFVVGEGKYVVTNYHVVSEPLDPTIVEDYVVLSGEGKKVKMLKGTVEYIDPQHDIALIVLSEPLTPLVLADESLLPAGTEIAFTGFPIGAILGLFPATHRGYISALTPDAIPAKNSDQLTLEMMKRLLDTSKIYQLDATAYPGNSGSPVYDIHSGKVVGIINKVIVKDTKESALSTPSGISYAIPVMFIQQLISRAEGKQ